MEPKRKESPLFNLLFSEIHSERLSGLPKGLMASDIRLVLHAPLVNLISSKMEELSAWPPKRHNGQSEGSRERKSIITLFCSVHALIFEQQQHTHSPPDRYWGLQVHWI